MLKIKPCHIKDAKEYVAQYHRHNIPPVGGKFAIACYDGDRLCGVVGLCSQITTRTDLSQ